MAPNQAKCKKTVVKTKVLHVRIRKLGFSDLKTDAARKGHS